MECKGPKMIAERTFDGQEGFIREGEKFKALTDDRAAALKNAGLARFENEKDAEQVEKTEKELIDEAKTHADIDGLVFRFALDGIPTKEDKATIEERKAAIRAALGQ